MTKIHVDLLFSILRTRIPFMFFSKCSSILLHGLLLSEVKLLIRTKVQFDGSTIYLMAERLMPSAHDYW